MSNRFKCAVIDDVTSRNIDANLQDNLLDLFESAIKSVATTLATRGQIRHYRLRHRQGARMRGFHVAGEPYPRRLTRRLAWRISAWRRTSRRDRPSRIGISLPF